MKGSALAQGRLMHGRRAKKPVGASLLAMLVNDNACVCWITTAVLKLSRASSLLQGSWATKPFQRGRRAKNLWLVNDNACVCWITAAVLKLSRASSLLQGSWATRQQVRLFAKKGAERRLFHVWSRCSAAFSSPSTNLLSTPRPRSRRRHGIRRFSGLCARCVCRSWRCWSRRWRRLFSRHRAG